MLEREAADVLHRRPVQPAPAGEPAPASDLGAQSLLGQPLSATLRRFVVVGE